MATHTQLTIFKHRIWIEEFYGNEVDGTKRDGEIIQRVIRLPE